MGKQSKCKCRWNSRTSNGKALLETDGIIFRGDFRLVIPLKEIKSIAAADGNLHIDSPQGKATFTLGAEAAKWAGKILHPPSRVDKLGVKAGSRVSAVKLDDAEFLAELKTVAADVTADKPGKQNDIVFYAAETRSDLKKLTALKAAIKPAAAIWVIYPKGVKIITAANVRSVGVAAGLVDVKVARFSERQTALKFVIPVKER